MNWSHASLEPKSTHSVTFERVLHGATVIAYLKPSKRGGYNVNTLQGVTIGHADTPAQAMLMAMRHKEAPRCGL